MRAPFGWELLALSIGATAITIWADSNDIIAIPAAVVAVASASLLFAEVALRNSQAQSSVPGWNPRAQPAEVRAAFTSGRLGREKLVTFLDRLELAGPTPEARVRTPDALDEILEMSREKFREYVRSRLDHLEAGT
ncbi:MAG TPA: hypothetical protein VEK13_04230 [Thermoplasmata archaeon]|nr:hypothetical protein [Thermoplasmata archaeon]